jgi:hypothetical protein
LNGIGTFAAPIRSIQPAEGFFRDRRGDFSGDAVLTVASVDYNRATFASPSS